MKKLNLLFMATLVAFGAMFSSCSKKDSTDATVTINFDNAAVSSGAAITGSIITTNSLKTVTVIAVATSGESTVKTITDFSALPILKSTDGVYTIYISGLASGSYKLTAVDENGVTSTQTFTVAAATGGGSTSTGTLTEVSASTTIYCTLSDGSVASTCASADGSTYAPNTATATEQAKIDFVYFYTSGYATIYSPDDLVSNIGTGFNSWTKKNATKFSLATSVENYASANATDVAAIALNASSTYEDLKAGDVVVFRTESGQKGIFKVNSINKGTAGNYYGAGANINISIKVIK